MSFRYFAISFRDFVVSWFTNSPQMLHDADIDVIQCLHAITFSTGLTQHNNLLNLHSIPSFTFIKHGIGNNGTNKSTSRGYQNIHLQI